MRLKSGKLVLTLVSATALLLTGCGGGGGGGSTAASSTNSGATTLPGTGAIGAPISGQVYAIDAYGKVSPAATTSALGAFTVDVGGMTAPFILRITGLAGGKQVVLNSVATAAGQTVNITPLTDLIVSIAAGQPAGSTLAALCTPVFPATVAPVGCLSALAAAANTTKLNAAVTAVTAMIAPLNTAGTNPLTGAFLADGTGMDAVLDQILVSPAEAQSAMATVTLIATNTTLGTASLPATAAGTGAAAPTATAPSGAAAQQSTNAATVLPEIRTCLAALSVLYPVSGTGVPTDTAKVDSAVDNSFVNGAGSSAIAMRAALKSTSAFARPGLTLTAAGFAPFNMGPLTTTGTGAANELATLQASSSLTPIADVLNARSNKAIGFDGTNVPVSAWIRMHGEQDQTAFNMKMVKTSDTTLCAQGWKLAGIQHMDMHMDPRISRATDKQGVVTYKRLWPAHAEKADLAAENSANAAFIFGAGMSVLSNAAADGVGAAQALALITINAGVSDAGSTMKVGSNASIYQNSDGIQSCQDLKALTGVADGVPCVDESKAAPGKVYIWILKSGYTIGNSNSGTVVGAFPFQLHGVPMSKAFAIANASSVFATTTSVTPATTTAFAGLVGTSLGAANITYNYTQQSSVYGSKIFECGLQLWANNTSLVVAKQKVARTSTSCTFGANPTSVSSPATSNSFSLLASPAPTAVYAWTSSMVLGNLAGSTQQLPD